MAIEQHPIPQDVAGYKFRLVGEMTLKQFMWLAVGLVLGFVFYSSPLPFFFKYPLAVLFASLGAGIAFVPVEGRPLDKWLIAFIRSIYSPTQFTWQKLEEVTAATVSTSAKLPITTDLKQSGTNYVNPSLTPTAAATTRSAQPIVSTTPGAPTLLPRDVVVPQSSNTTVNNTPKSSDEASTQTLGQNVSDKPAAPAAKEVKTNAQAKTDSSLPIPFTPSTPNTLVGMTLTPEGKILESALVELRLNGVTVRATKSNQLGQFLFAKALDNNVYQITTEKPGFTFDSYAIPLTGQIIKPLRLQARARQ